MSRFVAEPETAYRREVFLAVELLDALTLTRIRGAVKVEAVGLKGRPIVNSGGCYVWLKEDNPVVEKLTVDTDRLPYEKAGIDGADVKPPLTTILLHPTVDYEFPQGITGLRGTVIESKSGTVTPVVDGKVKLLWLKDGGGFEESPTTSRTGGESGDFVSVLRLGKNDVPDIGEIKPEEGVAEDETNYRRVTVRLEVRRGTQTRRTKNFYLLPGRITDPTTRKPLIFAWDDMRP